MLSASSRVDTTFSHGKKAPDLRHSTSDAAKQRLDVSRIGVIGKDSIGSTPGAIAYTREEDAFHAHDTQ